MFFGSFFLIGFLVALALFFWLYGEWLMTLPARRRLQREYRRVMRQREKGVEEEEGDDDEDEADVKKKRRREEREKDRKMWNQVVQWEVDLKIALTECNIPGIVKTLTAIRDSEESEEEEQWKGGRGRGAAKRKRRGCCRGIYSFLGVSSHGISR